MKVAVGDRVEKGAVIAIIEAMKAECEVPSPAGGVVTAIYAAKARPLRPAHP